MKQPAKTDIAVLLLFFNRADTFRQVFEAVKEAPGWSSWRARYGRHRGLSCDCK